MKTLILFLLLSSFAFSQNLVGYSFKYIKESMQQAGYAIEQGYTPQHDRFIIAVDNSIVKCYYFSDNNICTTYCLAVDSYDIAQTVLSKTGYQKNGTHYYSQPYKARIDCDKGCYIVFTFDDNATVKQ